VALMTISTLHDVDPLESLKLEHLEAQLVARFSPLLRPEEVQRCLIDCVARYDSARVRLYLPLLIERDATERLRDLSRSRLMTAAATSEPDDRGMT
jgi:hypothetical protein